MIKDDFLSLKKVSFCGMYMCGKYNRFLIDTLKKPLRIKFFSTKSCVHLEETSVLKKKKVEYLHKFHIKEEHFFVYHSFSFYCNILTFNFMLIVMVYQCQSYTRKVVCVRHDFFTHFKLIKKYLPSCMSK